MRRRMRQHHLGRCPRRSAEIAHQIEAGGCTQILDVRGPEAYAAGHVPGAIHLPHGKITEGKMREFPDDTLFITYCAGPHCNGATRGAIRLARLGRPAKIMIGGVTGWLDEGFMLEAAREAVA